MTERFIMCKNLDCTFPFQLPARMLQKMFRHEKKKTKHSLDSSPSSSSAEHDPAAARPHKKPKPSPAIPPVSQSSPLELPKTQDPAVSITTSTVLTAPALPTPTPTKAATPPTLPTASQPPMASAIPGSAIPGTILDSAIPCPSAIMDSAIPGSSTVLDSAIPSPALPDSVTPGPTLSDTAAPSPASPDSATADTGMPSSAIPDSAIPSCTIPDSADPASAIPGSKPSSSKFKDTFTPEPEAECAIGDISSRLDMLFSQVPEHHLNMAAAASLNEPTLISPPSTASPSPLLGATVTNNEGLMDFFLDDTSVWSLPVTPTDKVFTAPDAQASKAMEVPSATTNLDPTSASIEDLLFGGAFDLSSLSGPVQPGLVMDEEFDQLVVQQFGNLL
ncbi:hypothetical protein B0O80DRAFT_504106 [Mortierella sp. GBAus27b]|nr:hypothetical protein BGX31_004749 [Mortierella sp. GBA43]KAI8345698.1 hypothetical protein B0O80DRAFT_504106 [Mortierella sp. GBAus27b]